MEYHKDKKNRRLEDWEDEEGDYVDEEDEEELKIGG